MFLYTSNELFFSGIIDADEESHDTKGFQEKAGLVRWKTVVFLDLRDSKKRKKFSSEKRKRFRVAITRKKYEKRARIKIFQYT